MNAVCFNLEGPLSPQDIACNLMKLLPEGEKVLEILNRYDDLLISEKRANYEPGNLLSLIIPFLMYHSISEKDISDLATRATFTNGATELITKLNNKDWKIFCISTSYRQYALHLTQRLEIFSQNIACTLFPLDSYYQLLHDDDFQAIEQLEKTIVTTDSIDDEWIKTKLDTLFMNELPGTNFKPVLTEVRPVGGRYQVEALNKFASIHNKPLSDWLVVGNTVANIEMLQEVNRNGGISIAFNADKNVLPHATLGLASTRVDDLLPVFELWERDNRSELEKFIRNKEKTGGTGNRNHFHLFADTADISAALEVHTKISDIVKEEAAHPE